MKNSLIFTFFLLCIQVCFAKKDPLFPKSSKLIDKMALVVDDSIFTLSEIQKITSTYGVRKEISGIVYNQNADANINDKVITDLVIKKILIRSKLKEIGYNITDDVVEERVKLIETSQGVKRDDLIQFLTSKGINYEIYFELIRESIEFSQFLQKNIYPSIEISESELKNDYLKKFPNQKEKSIKYTLVAIQLPEIVIKTNALKDIINDIKDYRAGKDLPSYLSAMESKRLENVDEGNLNSDIIKILKLTPIGEFSSLLKVGGASSIFFVENKQFSETSEYEEKKENLKQELTLERGRILLDDWAKQESKYHYVNVLL